MLRLGRDSALLEREGSSTEPGSGDLRTLFEIHKVSPLLAALASDTRVAGAATQLLDDEVYVNQSRLNYKPGFRGKEFYWHSDFETWHVEDGRSEEHTSELQSLMRISYAVFCLKKKKTNNSTLHQ